jgi:hypothetical protein
MNQQARQALPENQMNHTPIPRPTPVVQRPAAPLPGEPHRDGVNAIIDQMTVETCEKIAALHIRLDELREKVIAGAADAKAMLTEQVSVRTKINDELTHMARVIDDIAARGRDE